MKYTVELLEEHRNNLFDRAKNLSKILEKHSKITNEYIKEYKFLDEKICELDYILHQIKKPS